MNPDQRKHIAGSFQTLALGQLAFFGYHGIEQFHYGWLVASVAILVLLEAGALFVLKGTQS